MNRFAKIFEEDDRQVVVMLDTDDEGKPEVRFYFKPKSPLFDLCSTKIQFEDDNETETYFEMMNANKAFAVIYKAINDLDLE